METSLPFSADLIPFILHSANLSIHPLVNHFAISMTPIVISTSFTLKTSIPIQISPISFFRFPLIFSFIPLIHFASAIFLI